MYICFYTAVKISACCWFMRTERYSTLCYDIKVLYWTAYFVCLFFYDTEKHNWMYQNKKNLVCQFSIKFKF